jgi:hypothetical protein
VMFSQMINAVNLDHSILLLYNTENSTLSKKMCQNTNQGLERQATGKTSG